MGPTLRAVPDDYPPEIIGYAEPWIVNPGDEVDVKVCEVFPPLSR